MASSVSFSRLGAAVASGPQSAATHESHSDIHFRVILCGEQSSGKTSFRQCTTQILSTRPDVVPTPSSTSHQYFSKIRGGGKLFLEVVDYGQNGERELLMIRKSAAISSMFVLFVNLSFVKQKVEKSIFSGRSDTVIIHNAFRDAIKKWVTLCYLAHAGSACPIVVVGTHKDFLTHQDEPALNAVLKELRSIVQKVCDELPFDDESSTNKNTNANTNINTNKNEKNSSNKNTSTSTTATSKHNKHNPFAPRLFGCFAVSNVDHSCFSENREGPKNIKHLWQFISELCPKLAHSTKFTTSVQNQNQGHLSSTSSYSGGPSADTALRSLINVLRHQRGLRAITLHDLFLFSLTQGIARKAMQRAVQKKHLVGDISLSLLRRGPQRISLALIDLGSMSKLLATLDFLKRRIGQVAKEEREKLILEGTSPSMSNAMNETTVSSESSLHSHSSAHAHHHSHSHSQKNVAPLSDPSLSSSLHAKTSTSTTSGHSPQSSTTPNASSSVKLSEEEKQFRDVDEIIKKIPLEKKEQIAQQGVVTWEVMSILGGLLGQRGNCTAEEKASLLWQMTVCSGYFLPCVSTNAVTDCLLNDSFSGGGGHHQQHNYNYNPNAQSSSSTLSFESMGESSLNNTTSSIRELDGTTTKSSSENKKNTSESNNKTSPKTFSGEVVDKTTAAFIFANQSSSFASSRRYIPREALDQIDDSNGDPLGVRNKFHFAIRKIIFHWNCFLTKQQLFQLFIGRLVNVASISLLCPAHLFDSAAWFRDRQFLSSEQEENSSPQRNHNNNSNFNHDDITNNNNNNSSNNSVSSHCRLLIHVENPTCISFRFLSSADTPLRVFASFLIEVTQAVKTVFRDFELHRVAKWEVVSLQQQQQQNASSSSSSSSTKTVSLSSPTSKFSSGPEDLSRLDLAFGS